MYELENVEVLPENVLSSKNIAYLGSSITEGSASMGVSYVEYISKRNNNKYTKEAISGTTLSNNNSEIGQGDSYVDRLVRMDTSINYDLFVCQLSTNDAHQLKPLGELSGSRNLEDFDTSTIYGAIEYIIAYVKKTWGCTVVFYTSPKFDNPQYAEMVEALYAIQEKWNIKIIDMYVDEDFNAITADERALYMADDFHPTAAGYLDWWTPYFEKFLYSVFE